MDNDWDLIIRNASIYDGSGSPPIAGDVAIKGDRIGAVGDVEGTAAREIDARGWAVAPGFIDVHTHDDFAIFLTPRMEFKTMQGVTTDVVGNCGLGAAPYPVALAMFAMMHSPGTIPTWEGYPGYLEEIDRNPPSLNVAVLVGHGSLRAGVMGVEQRKPSSWEFAQMRGWLRDALEAGAVGLSTGLVYEPGRYARTEEIIDLAREMASTGGLYASHMRNEAGGLLDSVRETIRIGEEAGVPIQISHHKASGRENWGKVRDSIKLIEQARERGIDVTADQYPYTSGSTSLAAVLQNRAFDDGQGGMGRVPGEKVLFASMPRHPEREGMTLKQMCDQWGLSERAAAERIIAEEGVSAVVVIETMDEADVRTVLRHPTTMIGSDGIAAGSRPHPRLYGTFPRVIGRYARDERLMSVAEAVHRMTGMPAEKFRLTERGLVRTGYFADLVIFDPESIADTGTYEDPRQYPNGLSHVFVNGIAIVAHGKHTGARPGRALRRGSGKFERHA
jgi:N-acyl-D-amino-acid deacylase